MKCRYQEQTCEISKVIHNSVRETQTGRMWFQERSLRKIAREYGLPYDKLSLRGLYRFEDDCVKVAGQRILTLNTVDFYLSIS